MGILKRMYYKAKLMNWWFNLNWIEIDRQEDEYVTDVTYRHKLFKWWRKRIIRAIPLKHMNRRV